MYRCQVCSTIRETGKPCLTYPIYRDVPYTKRTISGGVIKFVQATRREIQKEIKVCAECLKKLNDGANMIDLALRPSKEEYESSTLLSATRSFTRRNRIPVTKAVKLRDLNKQISKLTE